MTKNKVSMVALQWDVFALFSLINKTIVLAINFKP